eukprot:Nitzschia sp. Nitz4//scaffold194_size40385//4874//5370//NITZ4_007523-RA/size40385-augustus-gene-0.13-mRNA-1//-1//CDS//3329540313//6398//frame0
MVVRFDGIDWSQEEEKAVHGQEQRNHQKECRKRRRQQGAELQQFFQYLHSLEPSLLQRWLLASDHAIAFLMIHYDAYDSAQVVDMFTEDNHIQAAKLEKGQRLLAIEWKESFEKMGQYTPAPSPEGCDSYGSKFIVAKVEE